VGKGGVGAEAGTKTNHKQMTKCKIVRVRTRPNFAQREFWKSIRGLGGGQWGEGFVFGVVAFTRFLNKRRAIITLSSKNLRTKVGKSNNIPRKNSGKLQGSTGKS
jgi:hypothetical protein